MTRTGAKRSLLRQSAFATKQLAHNVLIVCGALLILAACAPGDDSRVVYVTATPGQNAPFVPPLQPSNNTVEPTSDQPAPTVAAPVSVADLEEHTVQAGDTLYGIAQFYGVSLDALLAVNDLENPNVLTVGQVIKLPGAPTQTTPDVLIVSDARFVRGPDASTFDVLGFVQQQPGFIKSASGEVETRLEDGGVSRQIMSAGDIVNRVAIEYSIDPRILLTLLEYQANWLSRTDIAEALRDFPLISEDDSAGIDRSGLYKQLAWAANQLNAGYYGWKYRGWRTLEFSGTERYLYTPTLNAGTVAIQHILSLNTTSAIWRQGAGRDGFYATYTRYFGDPLVERTTGADASVQPAMVLPFASGETWFFTGGAHGGWGSGSAWAAIDFAPPDEPPPGISCYTSEYWIRAVASGVIARSGDGAVVLDLDGDGNEATGWSVLYLHLAADGRVAAGTRVNTGDAIGRPSCAGGFSTGTHAHIARRYDGEWVPASCIDCAGDNIRPDFVMGGWTVIALRNQEYQGFLQNGSERRIAEQGRLTTDNRISW